MAQALFIYSQVSRQDPMDTGPFLCSLPTHCPTHAELRVASNFHEQLGAPKRLCSMLGLRAWNVNLSLVDSQQHHLKSWI